MVFVTVGNATQGFRRLLETVDQLTGMGFLKGEEVMIQSGNNPDFRPSNCTYEPFLPMEGFANKISEARLIICHAGAGALFHVLKVGKVPVVMPRQKKYGGNAIEYGVSLYHTEHSKQEPEKCAESQGYYSKHCGIGNPFFQLFGDRLPGSE